MIISIANFKGGTGKTTSCMNIGAALAAAGKTVLLIDNDPQHNLTQCFGITDPEQTTYQVLTTDDQLEAVNVRERLFLIPSSIELKQAEQQLAGKFRREYILEKRLQPAKDQFDYILIDCAPSLGLATINALMTSDLIFVPVDAEILGLQGLNVLRSEIRDELQLDIDRVFITKYDSRKTLHRTVRTTIDQTGIAFKTAIRPNVSLAEAPAANQTIFEYAPSSNGAKDYQSLTKEILKTYGKAQ
jgi:chromosome partitioning protein